MIVVLAMCATHSHTWCIQDSSIGGVQFPDGLSLQWLMWRECIQGRGGSTDGCAENVLSDLPMAPRGLAPYSAVVYCCLKTYFSIPTK